MSRWDEGALPSYLPPAAVLEQMEAAVLVTDRLTQLLYANDYARRLFALPVAAAGMPLLSVSCLETEPDKTAELARQVLRGQPWEGMFGCRGADGSRRELRAEAVPLRHPSGAVDGIVLIAYPATRRGQRERDRIALLERIGERLAGSLELGLTLRHVAETLVPRFADHCFIDLFQADKLVRRAQIHAGDWSPPAGTWARVGEQITYPEGHFCQQAMARMDAVLVPNLGHGSYPAPHSRSLRASEEVGLTSIVAAPLAARGELLGVMSLALSRLTDRDERHYDGDDRDFLGAIASRVAIAIDNALLYEEERNTALAFQRHLLPPDPLPIDGLEVAWRYVPAKPLETHGQGIQTQVGGDFYDLIPLSAGRVGIVIGDVEGRGARAAAVMGQLRAALRAFAQDDEPPAVILRKLDDWCRTLGGPGERYPGGLDPPMVSCTYLVYDAWSRTLTFANAGHDAPLLISEGEVGEMEVEHKGVLLGVRGKGMTGLPPYAEETRQLPPGCSLLLYTDGLTERRQRSDGSGPYSEDETMGMLRAAVREVASAGPAEIARAAESAVPGDIDDDMAIVVLRTSREDLESWQEMFPAEAIRVSDARRRAQAVFQGWGLPPAQVDLACLLVSEVVTNVVLHTSAPARRRYRLALEPAGVGVGVMVDLAGWEAEAFDEEPPGPDPEVKRFTLRLRRGASSVWVEVIDSDLRLPRIRSAGETDEGGRGLYLVDQLATRWGSRPTRDGKSVWFELPIATVPRQR